jgi:hypothetical protein
MLRIIAVGITKISEKNGGKVYLSKIILGFY